MATEPLVHVIDDDDAARDSLEFLLDCAGLKVRSYASATDFLDAAPVFDNACVIADVRMPGLSGIELVGRLKAQGITAPIIVITGHADVPLAVQAMKAGVADFIEKPFNDESILQAVRSALSRQASRGQADAERAAIRDRMASLSPREREVLDGLVAGHANKVIADNLGISARTVEVYRANVMSKMGAGSLSELVRMVTVASLASAPS
jgi:two-component system response regulator FixJ